MLIKILLISFLLALIQAMRVRHNLWSLQDKQLSKITDIKWNYCDLKCVYLENYVKDADFVVLNFQKDGNKFADCYVKNKDNTFDHWTKHIKNSMYSRICGDDLNINMESSPQYKLISIEGEGIGTEIND